MITPAMPVNDDAQRAKPRIGTRSEAQLDPHAGWRLGGVRIAPGADFCSDSSAGRLTRGTRSAKRPPMRPIHVIGGGLAGSEAAWQAAEAGIPVVLHEMRPLTATAAHRTSRLAELVCSNSFRSDDAAANAVGVLHREMRALGSVIMRSADVHQVPAGGALAVDRDGFSAAVESAVLAHPLVTLERGEVAGLPPPDWDNVVIATG